MIESESDRSICVPSVEAERTVFHQLIDRYIANMPRSSAQSLQQANVVFAEQTLAVMCDEFVHPIPQPLRKNTYN